jgi:hypothetical protein
MMGAEPHCRVDPQRPDAHRGVDRPLIIGSRMRLTMKAGKSSDTAMVLEADDKSLAGLEGGVVRSRG